MLSGYQRRGEPDDVVVGLLAEKTLVQKVVADLLGADFPARIESSWLEMNLKLTPPR